MMSAMINLLNFYVSYDILGDSLNIIIHLKHLLFYLISCEIKHITLRKYKLLNCGKL